MLLDLARLLQPFLSDRSLSASDAFHVCAATVRSPHAPTRPPPLDLWSAGSVHQCFPHGCPLWELRIASRPATGSKHSATAGHSRVHALPRWRAGQDRLGPLQALCTRRSSRPRPATVRPVVTGQLTGVECSGIRSIVWDRPYHIVTTYTEVKLVN